ncbi:MAG: hypothetical protein ABI461_05645, partial [Polyangiaceae bacterium]
MFFFTPACGDATFDANADTTDSGADGGGEGGSCSPDLTTDGQNCGACGNACTADQACVASKCVPGCQGSTIYVSNSGDDGKTGCTPATAKKTVGNAISSAKQGQFSSYEIHVCAGTYHEAVVLDYPISLRGSYDCSTWKQTAKYGFPSFDQANVTAIVAPDNATASTSFTVDDAAIGVVQVIDGFAIGGPKVTSGASTGLRVRSGKPTISNNVIGGGAGTGSPADSDSVAGSIGLRISKDAPKITQNFLAGGTGSANAGSMGSVGLYVDLGTGPATIQSNAIDGGKGVVSAVTAGYASVGVYLAGGTFTLTNANAISGNSISGGAGSGSGPAGTVGVFGLLIVGATADVIANSIEAGTANCRTCTRLSATAAAVVDPAPSHSAFVDNRIYGGDVDDAATTTSTTTGIDVETATPLLISDNLIHAGNGLQVAAHAGLSAIGILLNQTDGSVIEHNTIALGKTAGRALKFGMNETHNAVIDNLFVGGVVGGVDTAIDMASCGGSPTPISSLKNNGFVGFGGPALAIENATPPCMAGSYAQIGDMELQVAAENAATVSGNFAAKGSCGTDITASCEAIGACELGTSTNVYQACMDAVFNAWDMASAGAGSLTG